MPKPLRSRPLDLLYAVFLILHIPPSFLLDAQAVLPSRYFPASLRAFLANYIATSKDPLLSNIQQPHFAWLRAYMWCELSVQMLVFVVGPIMLYRDNRKAWPLLLLYASHGATTTLACLANILSATYLDSKQSTMLLASYVPYFVVPAIMAVDMTRRLIRALDNPKEKTK